MAKAQLSLFERLMTTGCGSLVQDESSTGCKMMYYLLRTCPFALLLVGTVGNLLNLVVLFRRQMRSQSTTVYLLHLAGSDLITLWNSLTRSTLAIGWGIDVRNWSVFTCATQEWLLVGSGCLSAELVALISIERMLFVKFPAWAKQKVTRRKTLKAAIGAVVLSVALSCPLGVGHTLNVLQADPATNGTTTMKCHIPTQTDFHVLYRTAYIIAGIRNIFAYTVVILSNAVIIAKLSAQRRRQQSRVQGIMTATQSANLERNRGLTRMTVILAVYMVITGLPFITFMNIFETLTKGVSDDEFSFYAVVWVCLYYIALSNCAMNFFFYFSSGPVFNREVRAIWDCVFTKVRQLRT